MLDRFEGDYDSIYKLWWYDPDKIKRLEDAMKNEKSPYYENFNKMRTSNLHKMKPIPICILPKKL